MGTAHWFSRKPNCRKRGVRSVVRAPFLGPWGSIAHRGSSVHLCTCNRGAQGWPPDLRREGGTRDFREQERCSWASRRIFLVGRAAAPFIRSDVKLWQTTSSDRLNELRRCTRPGGEALYPPRRSASIISTSIPCPVLPSSWTREHERTPLFGYFESVDLWIKVRRNLLKKGIRIENFQPIYQCRRYGLLFQEWNIVRAIEKCIFLYNYEKEYFPVINTL